MENVYHYLYENILQGSVTSVRKYLQIEDIGALLMALQPMMLTYLKNPKPLWPLVETDWKKQHYNMLITPVAVAIRNFVFNANAKIMIKIVETVFMTQQATLEKITGV